MNKGVSDWVRERERAECAITNGNPNNHEADARSQS